MAGGDRRRIDVRETQRIRQAMAEQGKADESRPRAPLEHAALARHSTPAQERDEILSELAPAAIEMRLIGNADPAERRAAIRLEPAQQRLDTTVLEFLPEIQPCLQH